MIKSTSIRKIVLRDECKQIRSALPVDILRDASELVCRHFQNWEIFNDAKTILTYMAMGSELDLSPLLLRHHGKTWGIPRVQQGRRMSFHIYDPDNLILHSLGMLEPDEDCAVIYPEDVDLTLVPGLAFNLEGWRLGYGGGYYDRFLSEFKGNFAGITYQELIMQQIPHTVHDIPMQFIIT
jgi:5-formyltetrahydrofolate cyclo-ligase